MWNSFRTDARLGIKAEVITYAGGYGDEIHAYFARPIATEPTTAVPGIVAVHHMPGWDEFYREFSERLARHGYSVICPDLYCRLGHGAPDDIAAVARSRGGVRDDSVVADCGAALRWLKALPLSNGKVGIIGTCSGGRHALLAASRVTGFDAVADLWGGGVVMAIRPRRARRAALARYHGRWRVNPRSRPGSGARQRRNGRCRTG